MARTPARRTTERKARRPAKAKPKARPKAQPGLRTVKVPAPFEPLFARAQDYVARYFSDRVEDPEHGTISISGERYILLRAASMSVEFFDLVTSLYQDHGPDEAGRVASNLLFDVAHAIGKADARTFHRRMKVTDPIERLSAGPIHFSFSGWAFVDISPESQPSPDENYFLIYDHPFSFESHTWRQRKRTSAQPVCVMSAGYSSGWCEESFGLPLVAAEIECQAAGGKNCRFIMAPPSRIEEHLARYRVRPAGERGPEEPVSVPEFFKRKRMEDELRRSHETLERRVDERTAEQQRTNELLRREIAERTRAEKVRDDFLSVAAHELRTPITSLRGFAQLIARQIESRGKADPDTLRMASTAIDRQCQKLNRLVTQLLDVSRLEAGRLVLDRTATDVMALVGPVVEAARATSERHAISVKGPQALLIEVDPLRLEQVLTNLVDNAVKYSPGGGPVQVEVADEEGAVRIAVTDRGLGVPEEHRPRIFDRFYQAHGESRLGGMGLGLWISHEIVEMHGGTLTLETPEAGGSRFVLRLPSVPPASG